MEYININIGHVTVTLREEFRNRFLDLFPESIRTEDFYRGWINSNNPSPSPIGFAVMFEDSKVYADFHNLPFYYGDNWKEYHSRIVAYVAKHPLFEGWKGHAHRFNAEQLPLLVSLLNQLIAEEEGDSEKTHQTGGNLNPDWIETRQLAPPRKIFVQRNDGEQYEDYVFRAILDIPNGENKFNIGGRNFLASWLIEKRERRNDEGLPNAAAMGLEFNNKENSIVTYVLDGKLQVTGISLGSGEEFEDGIIEEVGDNLRRKK
jgi:hypothetical protein